jgi:hypothetical protein
MIVSKFENRICKDKNILVILNENEEKNSELLYLIDNFCGTVINSFSEIPKANNDIKIYGCGDFSITENIETEFYIIKDLSTNYENWLNGKVQIISLGEVPIIVSNSGVYFRNLFSENDYFNKI